MSDSAHETVTFDRPPDSDSKPEVTANERSSDGGGLSVGQRWRDFTIEAPFPPGGAQAFIAEDAGSARKVIVRAFPIDAATEWRRGAWEQLATLAHLQTIRSLTAEEEGGWRYEVSAMPPSMTLQEWLACHRPVFAEVEAMVRQLADTLGALHAQGVVHLNIRPTAIFIDESGPEPRFLLGGLHQATLYTQQELTLPDVDPFYAPPEAVEPSRNVSGTRLCAWDWWSIGRVVQEFVLGRHVLGVVLDRDVSRVTPELRTRAEQLLLEQAPAGARAGALEYMQVEPGVTPLLRGLLSGSCEARWGIDAVQRWLRHEPVLDHYDLPRHARFWVYKGRGFTLAEAANHFTRDGNWEVGEDLLFHPERPDMLAAFLADSPAHRADWERLQAVCDLSETAGWGDVPVVARRTVTAALAWMSLGNGSGVRTALRVRGHNGDVVGLGEILRTLAAPDAVALITALLTPAVIAFVEPLDASAARSLKAIASKGGEAIQHGVQHGWLDPHDQEARIRIFELALKAGALLRDPIELLRLSYATSANQALATLFAERNPGPRDLVILAFTGESPERHGYVTHEEWKRQRGATLVAEAERIVTAQFWSRLRRMIEVTWIWGAPTPYFAGAVLVVTAVSMWLSRSAGPASAVAALLILSRAYFCSRMRSMVRIFDPAASAWMWGDGLSRITKEMEQSLTRHKLVSSALQTELARVRSVLSGLFKTKNAPVIREPRLWDLWAALGTSIAVTLALILPLLVQRLPTLKTIHGSAKGKQSVTIQTRIEGQPPSARVPIVHGVDPAVDVEALLATGRYEVIDDGFGRQLRGPLPRWTFFATDQVAPLSVVARASASPEQSAFAVVSGMLLVQPYLRTSAKVFLAIRVPTIRGFGIMVFNTRDRKLLNQEVLLVSEPLKEGSWYQLGSRRIGYLGTPAGLQSEISLAPP